METFTYSISRIASYLGLILSVVFILNPFAGYHGKRTGIPKNIPLLYLKGNNYEIGNQVGKAFKSVIQTSLREDDALHSLLLQFYKIREGKTAYNQLLSASEEYFPQYVEEIRGIADGAKCDFIQLFLSHIKTELMALIYSNKEQIKDTRYSSSSDFQVKKERWKLHVHSEDVPPHVVHRGVIWMAEVEGSEINNNQRESFVAFAYPGQIPGNAWSVNSNGLVMSSNSISPKHTFTRGMIPRRILARSLLKERNVEEVVDAITSLPGSSTPVNFMLSQRICSEKKLDCVRMTGIEVIGKNKGNAIHIHEAGKDQLTYHFNEFLHLQEDFVSDKDTRYREDRIHEIEQELIGPPSNIDEMKLVVSDNKNANYPIYRTRGPLRNPVTANIIFAEMESQTLSVYKAKPTESHPDVTFDIKPWSGRPLSLTDMIITPNEGERNEL